MIAAHPTMHNERDKNTKPIKAGLLLPNYIFKTILRNTELLRNQGTGGVE
jgi:hypothetical protein